MIDFPSAKHKFSFFLDRKSKKVTIDINSGSRVYSKHFNVESLTEDGVIRSVALMFKQGGVTLFLDCKKIGEQDLEADINRLYLNMEDPIVKIVRSCIHSYSHQNNNRLRHYSSFASENTLCTSIRPSPMLYFGPIVKSR